MLGRIPAYKPAFWISRFVHQLSPTQKCIYTWPIRKFLGVLKSYESESFISVLYVVRSVVLVPPWYPSFEKIFGVAFRFSFWSVLEHCGPKLSPWGYPKWSDDKDIQGKRHFWTILGALKFSARSDKMSWRNLKNHFVGGTPEFPSQLGWYAAQHFKSAGCFLGKHIFPHKLEMSGPIPHQLTLIFVESIFELYPTRPYQRENPEHKILFFSGSNLIFKMWNLSKYI